MKNRYPNKEYVFEYFIQIVYEITCLKFYINILNDFSTSFGLDIKSNYIDQLENLKL